MPCVTPARKHRDKSSAAGRQVLLRWKMTAAACRGTAARRSRPPQYGYARFLESDLNVTSAPGEGTGVVSRAVPGARFV